MEEALPPMRPANSFLAAWGLLLCPLAAGAGTPRHHSAPPAAQTRSAHSLVVFAAAVVHTAVPPVARPHLPTAADLYPKSLHADDLYSYRGRQITTYWHSGRAEAVVISHLAADKRRIDYLAPDVERGRSVVTDGVQQWQYDPRSRQLLHRRLEPNSEAVEDAAESYELLRQNYVLQIDPATRTFADRKAFLLSVTRKTNRKLARKLWIDAATGLVLKQENYREDGKLALTVAFSDINYHALLPPALFDLSALAKRPGVRSVEEPGSSERPLSLNSLRSQLGGTAVAPPALNGFHLVSAALTQDGAAPLLHLRYSDGLTLVSLFEQRRTQVRRPTRVPPSMRPTRIGGRDGHVVHHASLTALNWDTDTLNLTLMGEVAETSLRALGTAMDLGGRR